MCFHHCNPKVKILISCSTAWSTPHLQTGKELLSLSCLLSFFGDKWNWIFLHLILICVMWSPSSVSPPKEINVPTTFKCIKKMHGTALSTVLARRTTHNQWLIFICHLPLLLAISQLGITTFHQLLHKLSPKGHVWQSLPPLILISTEFASSIAWTNHKSLCFISKYFHYHIIPSTVFSETKSIHIRNSQ